MISRHKRVLFVTYGGGHVNALLPVILRLRERRPDVDVSVLGLTTAAKVLRDAGIPCLGFKDYLRPSDTRAVEYGLKLSAGMAPGPVDSQETIAYLGLSYADLVDRAGESAAEATYAEKGRHAFLPVSILERVFDAVQPDVVMATNSPRAERASILVARTRGIPALCLGDLWLGFELEWIGARDFADRVLVLNEFVRQKLIDAGRDPAHVEVTGNPAFDRLADPVWRKRGLELREALGGNSRKVVLWMSHAMPWAPEIRERTCQSLIESASRHADWKLVLRTHPNEPPLNLQLPDNVTTSDPRLQPAAAMLHACDVGVTMMSTMGLEAVLLGVPMVTTAIVPAQRPSYIDLEYEMYLRNMQLAVVASTYDQIEPAIETALKDRPDHRHRLPKVGGATAAVCASLERFLHVGNAEGARQK